MTEMCMKNLQQLSEVSEILHSYFIICNYFDDLLLLQLLFLFLVGLSLFMRPKNIYSHIQTQTLHYLLHHAKIYISIINSKNNYLLIYILNTNL